MDAEDYDITPANSSCGSKTVVVSNPGSQVHNTQNNLNALDTQNTENSQYDSPTLNVQPLYGGKKNKIFTILFRHNKYTVEDIDEIKAIKKFLKDTIYKRDYILKISCNKIESYYIIRRNQKYKFKKIYYN
jgi:hypothetical protein